ncbi:uncharacterized protein P884DRAFT_300909 [Thermothelomyces heterothallicus CBS 202.75]|uniref:uncharacterized protein n=1 Tax=Thermothelomyces heterothallicus CBS 202.75 TaxID=1149848 RepID=UPI003743BCF5
MADVSSARGMFAAYCAMNDATTKFPVPSTPRGDMSYYITDLPDYSSLAPKAAAAAATTRGIMAGGASSGLA